MVTQAMPAGSSYREFVRLASIETDECVLWPHSTGGQRGYGIFYDAEGSRRYTHREALRMRQAEIPGRPYAAHGPCNNAACMNYRHLRWATPTENSLDKRRDGTDNRGPRHPMARLSESDVRLMRERWHAGAVQRALANEFGVSPMTVSRAVRGESWSCVA